MPYPHQEHLRSQPIPPYPTQCYYTDRTDVDLITIVSKPRLRKLSNLYHPQEITTTFPKALSEVILRHNTTTYKETFTKERKLRKQHKKTQQLEYKELWQIPDTLYDALYNCFQIKRVIHCNPMILPLRAKEYICRDPKEATFGAIPYTKTVWPDGSLALPAYKAEHLTTTLEQAMYSAHVHRHTQPSSPSSSPTGNTLRTLPGTYTPHTYKKLTSIPYLPTHNTKKLRNNTKLNIFLVANNGNSK
jgi:hypothetical protein